MEKIINLAISQDVNDIYILPAQDNQYVIKFHVNGEARTVKVIKFEEAEVLISAIKYRANMDITERRRPQLGRLTYKNIWIRVSSVGDFLNQETLVMRLIYQQVVQKNWLIPEQIRQVQDMLPQTGLFLISGPTGSGKTTTLYHLLDCIRGNKLVLTIEDPVEIQHPDFVQLQVNDDANMGYDALIKVALRHRPEILLIGEIRDYETAKSAIRAALSGHLILSTIHAMSARDVVSRLLELGIDKQQLSLALNMVVYQRLLPTRTNGQAALLDYLSEQSVNKIIKGQIPEKFSTAWKGALNEAIKNKSISEATYKQYQQL